MPCRPLPPKMYVRQEYRAYVRKDHGAEEMDSGETHDQDRKQDQASNPSVRRYPGLLGHLLQPS